MVENVKRKKEHKLARFYRRTRSHVGRSLTQTTERALRRMTKNRRVVWLKFSRPARMSETQPQTQKVSLAMSFRAIKNVFQLQRANLQRTNVVFLPSVFASCIDGNSVPSQSHPLKKSFWDDSNRRVRYKTSVLLR